MKLVDFSNDRLDQSKAYEPFYPNGTPMEGVKIYLRSMKSTKALKAIDEISRRYNQQKNSIEREINRDIDYCCAVIDAIEGFTIEPEDNSLDFDLDGNKVISNEKNIRLLMKNFIFLRHQIGSKVQDDSFFYEN